MADVTRDGEPRWWDEIARVAQRVSIALLKFLVLLLFMGMHWVLDRALTFILPVDWVTVREMLQGIFAVAFILLYVDQLVEMMAVFFPRLGTLHGRFHRGDTGRQGGGRGQ